MHSPETPLQRDLFTEKRVDTRKELPTATPVLEYEDHRTLDQIDSHQQAELPFRDLPNVIPSDTSQKVSYEASESVILVKQAAYFRLVNLLDDPTSTKIEVSMSFAERLALTILDAQQYGLTRHEIRSAIQIGESRARHKSTVQIQPAPIPVVPDILTDEKPSPNIDVHEILHEPGYPTKWQGQVTLEELLTDIQVRKVAFAKARSLGYTDEDAQDCFQLGSINLWKALQEQPALLCDKGAAWVGVWIAFSGSRRTLWKHKERNVSFDDQVPDRNTIDERLVIYQRGRPERWASWATRADKRIDFALLMNALAQRYDGDPIKLFALYSLTTSTKMRDLLGVAKAHKNQFIEARNDVKNDMRVLLEMDADRDISDEFWTEQLQREENLECVTRVAEQVLNNQRLLLALYIVTTSAKRKDVAELFSIGITAFRKEITQVKCMLTEEFRKAKRRTPQEKRTANP